MANKWVIRTQCSSQLLDESTVTSLINIYFCSIANCIFDMKFPNSSLYVLLLKKYADGMIISFQRKTFSNHLFSLDMIWNSLQKLIQGSFRFSTIYMSTSFSLAVSSLLVFALTIVWWINGQGWQYCSTGCPIVRQR